MSDSDFECGYDSECESNHNYDHKNTYEGLYNPYMIYKLENQTFKKDYACYDYIYKINKLIRGGGLLKANELDINNDIGEDYDVDYDEYYQELTSKNDKIIDKIYNESILQEYEIKQKDTLIFSNNPILDIIGNDESNLPKYSFSFFLDEIFKMEKSDWESNFTIIQCENGKDFDTLAEVLRPSGKWDNNIWDYNDKNRPEILTSLMRKKNVSSFDINERRSMKYIQIQKGDKYYHLESSILDRRNMEALSAKIIYNKINTFLDNNNGTMLSMIRAEYFGGGSETDNQCYIFTYENKYVHIIIRNYKDGLCKCCCGITASSFDFYECKLQINNIPNGTIITIDYLKDQLLTCDNITILYCYNQYRGVNFDVILLELKKTYDAYSVYSKSVECNSDDDCRYPVEYGDFKNESNDQAVAFITGNDLVESLIGKGNTYNKCSDCKSYHQNNITECPYKEN